ncbi:MAG: DUF86 domain-containing protein [Candidatus Thorarchaeota archaeon]|nr:DUF86 domain-containing protein [Candidatus Thorarchaeota archaeon]
MGQRILSKLDEHDQIMHEIRIVLPPSYVEYKSSLTQKRAIERLIQIAIECVIDLCAVIVSAQRLGIPSSEMDVFSQLEGIVFDASTIVKLREMKRFGNRIVHRYGNIDDAYVLEAVHELLSNLAKISDLTRQFLVSHD